jgi:orotate phosphoribosyltransferase
MSARTTLIDELRRHALVIGDVTLTSGRTASYYVDAKRAILRPAGFTALGELVADYAREWEATAVGGLTMGADAPACAALAAGADVKAFFVRKDSKQHGLQRRVEGPPLDGDDRCLVVEDVVTTGGSTRETIEVARAAGAQVVGAASIIDRSGGKADGPGLDVPYHALASVAFPTYQPDACPLCASGLPVVKPGSRA